MRYLYATLLLLLYSADYCYAQPRLELAVKGGMLNSYVLENKVDTWSTFGKQAYGAGLDLLGNKFNKRFTLSYGIHTLLYMMSSHEEKKPNGVSIGRNTTENYYMFMLTAPVGAHYKMPVSKEMAFRVSVGAGPVMLMTGFNDSKFRFYSEVMAGLMFRNKWTLGVKYAKPIGKYGDLNYYPNGNAYAIDALQLEARMMIPGLKDLSPETIAAMKKKHLDRIAEHERRVIIYQENERKKTERDNARGWYRRAPSVDLLLHAGMLLPAYQKQHSTTHNRKTNLAGIAEIGMEVMSHRRTVPVFISMGGRIGYVDLKSTDQVTGKIDYGTTIHGSFQLGVNYGIYHDKKLQYRFGLLSGGGFRVDGANDFGSSPFYYFQFAATHYPNERIGLGLNISKYYGLNTAYSYVAYGTRLNGGNEFNIWSVSADVRISLHHKQ